ncbi:MULTISPECIES: DUF4012 domain-containing protein [unclassified Bifidobacterium]|uniref:DUF4012 domain-containing protein n=1 Tax=unclassified Bifidobacterium TaxID=2608897 RepID=UPI002159260C|nr:MULTISPECIES: DUF4012 domain-containing protein [unclassified Bifidobacterium]
MVDAANTMQQSGLTNADGSFNVKTLTAAGNDITAANAALQEQVQALDAVPEPHISQVRMAIDNSKSMLNAMAEQIGNMSDMLGSLSALFGHSGTRNYLILSQTNAETQAAGGVVGSVGTMTVENGKVSIGKFHSDSEFTETAPVSVGDNEIDKMYAISRLGVQYGGDIRLASATPNFPIGAEYARQVWVGQSFGSTDVDGMVSFDTLALQSLIGVTGNIMLSTGQTLTSQNAAQYLANQVYIDIPDQAAEDAFFQESAQRIIDASFSGMNAQKALQLMSVVPSLAKGRHIYMWSFDKSDQKQLRAAGMTGEPSTNAQNPVAGVYVNEMGWTKSDWYLQRNTTVKRTSTNADGSATYHVTAVTKNTMTADQAQKLPVYITGTFPTQMINELIGQSSASDDEKAVVQAAMSGLTQPGVVGHSFMIAQPAGGSVKNIKITSDSSTKVAPAEQTFTKVKSNGATYWMNLAAVISPGSTVTLEFDVTTASGATSLTIDQTPANGDSKITYEY